MPEDLSQASNHTVRDNADKYHVQHPRDYDPDEESEDDEEYMGVEWWWLDHTVAADELSIFY